MNLQEAVKLTKEIATSIELTDKGIDALKYLISHAEIEIALSKPSVVSVQDIEKEIDREYYLSDYNDKDYENDFMEYKARRERISQAIHNLIMKGLN